MKGVIMKQETITELNKQVEELTKQILNEKINASNIDNLGKVIDIYKDIKEAECMNYTGNYGNYGNNSNYSIILVLFILLVIIIGTRYVN